MSNIHWSRSWETFPRVTTHLCLPAHSPWRTLNEIVMDRRSSKQKANFEDEEDRRYHQWINWRRGCWRCHRDLRWLVRSRFTVGIKRCRLTFAISENVVLLFLWEMAQIAAELVGISCDFLVEPSTSTNGGYGDAEPISVVTNHHLCRPNDNGQYKNP